MIREMRLIKKIKNKILLYVGVKIHQMNNSIAQATLPKFGNDPKNLTISLPRRINNSERIFLGDNVSLGPGSFLYAVTHYPTDGMRHPWRSQSLQTFNSKIIIGNNVTSTGDLQIAAQSLITIEDDVMFASNIHINDALHGSENANEPYKYQKISRIAPILIKRGCWIGQNVVILPGVTIGELSIIGANSVVTKSIPDRCIAVGNPAKIIRRWDESTGRWITVTTSDRQNTIMNQTVSQKVIKS
jgi:acetyltransferase-like isoleucine patch superfamily enzyme